HCHQCGMKNHLKAQYCNQCGARLREDRALRDPDGRVKLYADIAHPINSQCREMIQNRVIAEYRIEQERAKQPGYVSRYDDDFDDDIDVATYSAPGETAAPRSQPSAPPPTVHAQPTQGHPPPPHILPPPLPGSGSTSTGGPHFGGPPQREAAKEA